MDALAVEVVGLGGPAALAAGGLAWHHFAPASFWYGVGFPVTAARVYATWGHVAAGCGLARRRRRWRWSFEVPLAGEAVTVTTRRRLRRVEVRRAPRLGIVRPTRHGFRVTVRLHDGQTPEDYRAVADRLAHAWRVHAVRVVGWTPGRVTLAATVRDPLTRVTAPPAPGGLLKVAVGRLETGEPWVIDFRTVPHWLIVGATQSGKSTLLNALVTGLAPQPVALVGFDLKGGVELTPYAARLSALATTRAECLALLADLVAILAARMRVCRERRVRNIWKLDPADRPTPVVVLVDEVAELVLTADRAEKEEVAKTATALLRVAQLGRAFGVYLVVAGQRVGSDLGPGVTALRSQLSGRVCHRVNDPETAAMTLGDHDPAALAAARTIPPATPGVAIVTGPDGSWHRARSLFVSEAQAEQAAQTYAHLAPAWADLTAGTPGPAAPADPALTAHGGPGDPAEAA